MNRLQDVVAFGAMGSLISLSLALSFSGGTTHPVASPVQSVSRSLIVPVSAPLPNDFIRELKTGIAACFDPENPPSAEWQETINWLYASGGRYIAGSRWTSTAVSGMGLVQGDPLTILWSFAPDGLNIPNGVGEPAAANELFARMDSLFASRGGRATWVQQFTRSFARYEALSGISYQRVTTGGNDWDDGASWGSAGAVGLRGDVRISMKNIDGSNGVLAYNSFPGSGGGDMVIDRSESWGSSTGNQWRFLRNTIMHEHGHGLGFSHVCPIDNNKLMEPFLNTNFDGLQEDEVRAVQRNYGDPFEPNNTSSLASDLGTLNSSSTIGLGTIPTSLGDGVTYPSMPNASLISIDANGEQDWWKFTPSTNLLATVTITPVGSIYDESAQTQACNTGTPTNAAAIANLTLRLYAGNGSTLVGFAENTAEGSPEVLTSVLMTGGQVAYAVAYESSSQTQTQSYRLTITAASATSMTASDNASSSVVNLSWTTIPGATDYQIFRSSTNNFASATQIANTASISYADSAVSPSSTYFYWVKATQSFGGQINNQFVGNDQGSTSAPPAPGAFSLVSPAAAATNVSTSPLFDWSDSSGATSYTILVDNNSNFSSPEISTSVGSSQYQAAPNALVQGTTYFWKVTASNLGGSTASSPASSSFTTAFAAPGPFSLLAPANNSTGISTEPLFDWSDSANSSSYTIVVDDNADFSSPVINTASAASQYQAPASTLDEGTTYFWKVTATGPGGSLASSSFTFTTQTPPPACPADFNDDGFVDGFDYDDFVACFEGFGCPPGADPDFNNDGFADGFDYDDYLTAFEAGCD